MLSSRNLLMLTGLGAVLAVTVVFAGVAERPGTDRPLPVAVAQPMPLSPATSTVAPTTAPTTAPSTAAKAAADGTDQQGFVGSHARCDDGQSAVAFGRTQRSKVVICTVPAGGYEYRGVRISDGATLTVAAEATGDGTYTATTEGAEYTVSPANLSVTAGGKLIYRDTWVVFVAPSYAAEHGSTATPTTAKPR